jgi:pyruvate kinase
MMVTMPTSAGTDPTVVDRLARLGMGLVRINTAYDGPEQWHGMIRHAHETADRQGLDLRIVVDLAGSKLRVVHNDPVRLRAGEVVCLGSPSDGGPRTEEVTANLRCSAPEVLAACRRGDRVVFDDGKFAGVVVACAGHSVQVRIDYAPPGGAKLKPRKGVNLPDTPSSVPAVTQADRRVLEHLAPSIDAVSLSFVRTVQDVLDIRRELARLHRSDLPVIVKVETAQGFRNLPDILAAGLCTGPLAVMVARGDLAVEVGYERLAEVQEEILWLCEAAHVPTIWATPSLETLAKTGRPSRSEITDAAEASRAECAMLNKGAFVTDALLMLDDVLGRMAGHQHKKRSLLRRLSSWDEVLVLSALEEQQNEHVASGTLG